MSTEFDVKKHLIQIKGKDYLPVAARLVWFRQEHPDWSILTESLNIQPDHAIFRATIMNPEGRIIATATKMETKAGWQDYVEKAETGSIGRALALSGYGTQFAPELEEGEERIADSPQAKSSKATTSVGQAARERAGTADTLPACEWPECKNRLKGYTSSSGKTYTPAQLADYSKEACDDHIFCYHHKQKWEAGERPDETETLPTGEDKEGDGMDGVINYIREAADKGVVTKTELGKMIREITQTAKGAPLPNLPDMTLADLRAVAAKISRHADKAA